MLQDGNQSENSDGIAENLRLLLLGTWVQATVNTGKDFVDSDGHRANPSMLCADCAEADRQMELQTEINRRRRTEADDIAR